MSEARARWEMLNLIRREKFDIILPKAMRENEVDMWIHAMREGNPDPLSIDLGGDIGYFIFTDRGSNRIERAVLGGYEDELRQCGAYDIFGTEKELRQFVTERDPRRIAVNMSEWIAIADGLSYTSYLKLIEALGEKYAKRLVSAGQLITDFRTRRVISEIVVYGQLGETTRQLLERALSNEVIIPGVTTLEDVGWWIEDQLLVRGMSSAFELSTPRVIHSAESDESEYRSSQYVIQRGDLLQYDFGISFMNLGTDFKRVVYALREEETVVPPGIQNGWDQALKARDVIRKNIKVGRTAGETLKILGKALEEAGFDYIHLTTDPMLGGFSSLEPEENNEDSVKTGVSIDCHCVGNTGNSEVASGPSIAGFRPDRANITIKPTNLFAFEFVAFTPVPEWQGRKVRFNIEDDAIVTENGVEWLYPPNERILLIR
ncbi:MAG: M24 family metallopeptidase [Candidatus Hodarchaeales archaeon]